MGAFILALDKNGMHLLCDEPKHRVLSKFLFDNDLWTTRAVHHDARTQYRSNRNECRIDRIEKTQNATFERIKPNVPGFFRIRIRLRKNLGTFGSIPSKVAFFIFAPFGRSKRNKLIATCLLYTSPSPRDLSTSRMPSSA